MESKQGDGDQIFVIVIHLGIGFVGQVIARAEGACDRVSAGNESEMDQDSSYDDEDHLNAEGADQDGTTERRERARIGPAGNTMKSAEEESAQTK